MSLKAGIQSTRPPFLILTPVCVFLGAAVALSSQVGINVPYMLLALIGALAAHVSVNTFNEYLDFKSGLDLNTRRTPFSGGSGALPAEPAAAPMVMTIAILSLLVTMSIGLFFLRTWGINLLPIGLLGLLLIVLYTNWINKLPWLCLISPGTGFGFLMVVGTYFVLTGEYTTQAWLAATVPFCLVNNLLLLNQYPDIEADRAVGRRHFVIAYGIKGGNYAYAFFVLAVVTVIIVSIAIGLLPAASLITLVPLPLAVYALCGAVKYGGNIGEYPAYMAANVAVVITSPVLLGVALLF